MQVNSFPPLIGEGARVLITGTAPSVKSLERKQFYGNPQNYFWRIMYGLLAPPERRESGHMESYEERKSFLLQNGIALWDVIDSCERTGSLDANIKDEKPNPIPDLIASYPSICCIAFNGSKAYKTFQTYFGSSFQEEHPDVALLPLPSSSPIPTKYMRSLEDRLTAWRAIMPYMETTF